MQRDTRLRVSPGMVQSKVQPHRTSPTASRPSLSSDSDEEPTSPTQRRTTPTASKDIGLFVESQTVADHTIRRRNVVAGHIVDSRYFTALTTALTIWVLAGDDIRIIFTQKPADPWFDIMVGVCFIIFFVEIVLSWLGKEDYKWSFYFFLDLIATATLLLDITFVADGSLWDSDDNAKELKGGRTARLGAKYARVVRVIRLIRILKLYKAYYEAHLERRRKLQAQQERTPGNDDWDEADFKEMDKRQDHHADESRIGKRLSEMTTRRTICFVLGMLIVLPLLVAEEANQAAFSAEYGADHIWQQFEAHAQAAANSTTEKASFDSALLQYIFYHNWFAQASDDFRTGEASSELYYGGLFWVGIIGTSESEVESEVLRARISQANFDDWKADVTNRGIFTYGTMPSDAEDILHSPWRENCDGDSGTSLRYRRGFSLLSNEINGLVSYVVSCPDDLRKQEYVRYFPRLITHSQYDMYHLSFYFDLRDFNRVDSYFGLGTTLFVMVLLLVGSLMFSQDANNLVVHPVENMIKRVLAIRDDPLIAVKMSDKEFQDEEIRKAMEQRQKKEKVKKLAKDLLACNLMSRENEIMETLILEKTIIKLASLLVLGFGEAGANIISQNMREANSAVLNPMVPGTTVECVIGVTRVRNFSTATEVLQAKIMTFVNQIAEIVHGVANEFHGAPNKNSGETFLTIWRADEEKISQKRLCEMSVVAFSKMLAALHRSPLLAGYRHHPGLQYRLGENCRINFSFGLHAGWAIEGAVGSEFKIDASYLSPNVSIAQTMENMTRMYGVTFIVAQSVVEHCSNAMMANCRLIDKVLISGSKSPMEIYCVDLDFHNVRVDDDRPLKIVWNIRNRFKARQFLESEKNGKLDAQFDLAKEFQEDEQIKRMRSKFTTQFFQLFNMGYQNYSQGEWQVARKMLSQTQRMLGFEDGPSRELIRFMEANSFEAPLGWKGVRAIGSKLAIL